MPIKSVLDQFPNTFSFTKPSRHYNLQSNVVDTKVYSIVTLHTLTFVSEECNECAVDAPPNLFSFTKMSQFGLGLLGLMFHVYINARKAFGHRSLSHLVD